MKSRSRDKAGGSFDRVRGRVKEATGALTGNEKRKSKGRFRQDKGSARKKRGHLRDFFRSG